MRQKRDFEAFIDGYKSVLIMEHDRQDLQLVEHYPRFQNHDDYSYFFHTEEQKQQFVDALDGVERGSYEETCLTGIALGYPRRSVEFFAENNEIEKQTGELPNREFSVIVQWAGLWFTSHVDFVHEEIRWLWNTYDHPKAVEHSLCLWAPQVDSFDIPYGDFDKLEQARQYIIQKRGLVPVSS
jgi:hypothetical protein